jgi:hypothetical protein
MAKFMFRLERMHVDIQRGKQPDVYVSTFGIEVGNRNIGPIGRFLDRKGPQQGTPGIQSGDEIELSNFPPDNPPSKWGTWDIGPVEVGPDDIVAVDYAFVNTSDNGPSISRGDQTKIAITTYTAVVSVGLAATGVGAVAAAVVAGVGAVLGEIFGGLLGSDPKCNGLAFADKVVLTSGEIAQGTSNSTGQMTITRNAGNPDIPKDCGRPSSADITFSVTAIPVESVRRFLGSKGNLKQGLKEGLNLTKLPVSIRSLIDV